MRTHLWKAVLTGTLITMSAAACSDDTPLDEGVGEVALLQFDRGFASVAPGDTITLSVSLRDQFNNPVAGDVDFTACDAKITVGDVRPDSVELFPRTIVDVIGTDDLGYSCLEASAGSEVDTVDILVVPPYPVLDTESAAAGDVVTVTRAEGQPEFDSNTTVQVGDEFDSYTAFTLSQTADQIEFVVPFSLPAGDYFVSLVGAGASDATITGDLTITSVADPNESDFGSEVDMDVPLDVISLVTDEDVDDVYSFTATEDGTVDVTLDWDEGSSDLDLYIFDSAGYAAGEYFNYGWYDHPEHFQADVEAGETYYVYVNNYSAEGPTTYRLTVEYAVE